MLTGRIIEPAGTPMRDPMIDDCEPTCPEISKNRGICEFVGIGRIMLINVWLRGADSLPGPTGGSKPDLGHRVCTENSRQCRQRGEKPVKAREREGVAIATALLTAQLSRHTPSLNLN